MDEAFKQALEKVLAREVPEFTALTGCTQLTAGASQETYCVTLTTRSEGETKLALRRTQPSADPAISVGGISLETEAIRFEVAGEHNVPGPEVIYVLQPQDNLGDGFLMQWLQGETLGQRIVKAPELAEVRPKLARQCGEILGRIHAIDWQSAGLDDKLPTIEPAKLVQETWAYYRDFNVPVPMIDYCMRWLMDNLPTSHRLCLVHGDFRNGNLMVTPEGVNAVLDWELAQIGDPVRDLGWLCTHSWRFGCDELAVGGFGRIDDLLAGYAAGGGCAVAPDHLHFWQVFGSFWWAVGCLRMADQFRHGPDRSVERPAIGRRSSECQADCVNLLIPGPVARGEADPGGESDANLPRNDELLDSVAAFLREDAAAATSGRTRFFTRVAANSLTIVKRELALGPAHRQAERARLMALLDRTDSLDALRRQLTSGLRDGSIALDRPQLREHLRASVINQLAIDQPTYAALATAIAGD